MLVIKAKSSFFIKNISKQESFRWQDGYEIFSVSVSVVEKVIQYINHQKEHHQMMSFQEEFTNFLKGYQIQYEDKYFS